MTLDIMLWFVAVQAAGLAVLPLALRLFHRLPDGGYALAKPLGLLLLAYAIWLPAMLGFLDYERSTALLLLLLIAVICWRWAGREALIWLRARRSLGALEEAILGLALLLGGFVRAYNADIIGQEKFMDLAFFNGFLAASALPAEDTWLAGYGMPYYPFGYFLLSVPAKLAGLPAAYGYNLALVLVFGLTILLSASLAANLVALFRRGQVDARRLDGLAWLFGLVSAALVALCGNLVGPLEVIAARGLGSPSFWELAGVKNLQAAADPHGWLPGDDGWWWHASRVIPTIQPDGITEFPYFSFLLGDLHPHFMVLPLLLLIVGLSLALLLEGRPRCEPLFVAVAALALGVPIVANTWDIATFWALYGLIALLVAWRSISAGARPAWGPLAWALAPLPLAVALFSPYFVGYASQRLGLGIVSDRTPLVSLLILFAPLLLLCALFSLRLALAPGATSGPAGRLLGPLVLLLGLGAALGGRPTAGLALGLLALLLSAGWQQLTAWLQPRQAPAGPRAAVLFLSLLAGLGLFILAAAEFVFLSDSFGTRMNTVFKFYYHVWLLLGLLGGPALAIWLGRSAFFRPRWPGRLLGSVTLAVVLGAGLVYPLAATWSKSKAFAGPPTLDGAAFLSRSKPGDAAAIRWLAQRPNRPVVLEAVGDDYQEFARVSTFSGLPTVIGWIGHELQWRGALDEFSRRRRDVETVYQRAERDDGLRILDQYRVSYVFVGTLEREKYGPQVEERLARWLQPVFRQEGATVFGVPREVKPS